MRWVTSEILRDEAADRREKNDTQMCVTSPGLSLTIIMSTRWQQEFPPITHLWYVPS